jgi:hypothetical protein
MEIKIVNKSNWSTESLQAMIDFLAPCYGHLDMPVRITFRNKSHRACNGVAYFPAVVGNLPRNPMGTYNVAINIGQIQSRTYPIPCTYKIRSGAFSMNSPAELLFHVIAHELRHVEQFAATRATFPQDGSMPTFKRSFKAMERNYPSGSSEVDAEKVAHGLTAAYRVYLEKKLYKAA